MSSTKKSFDFLLNPIVFGNTWIVKCASVYTNKIKFKLIISYFCLLIVVQKLHLPRTCEKESMICQPLLRDNPRALAYRRTNHALSHFPAGIWCENDVVLTSMRRDYVASTLIRRHFDTKCPLGCSIIPSVDFAFGYRGLCYK